MYLNHSVSIALFRGLQKFYEENPDAKEFMSKAIVERAPQTSNEL